MVTFENSWLERLRIPLVFYSQKHRLRANPDWRLASQVDVLPTALALFSGEHRYAGMGRNLLDPAAPEIGLVTGTSTRGYYLKRDFVLSYEPLDREAWLFGLTNENLTAEEVAGQNAEIASRMRQEYFATVELAKRLALGKQIFPMSTDRLDQTVQSATEKGASSEASAKR